MTYRSKLRGAVIGACTAALVASCGLLVLPAQAADGAAPATVAAVRQESNAVKRVTAFYDQYRAAVEGTNPAMNPREVRNEFLTPALNHKLDAWAETNVADPVFRAQNVPADRSVRYEGSGAGHATVVVTEYWGSGSPTEVWYRAPLDGSRISDLTDPPSA
ncbi:hypothetical protein C8250_038285 [Streptomyces sp. So13.3]|uniref:hypothetical protein n=1 Tax=Streptomyces sp. So13.3 TaxID=2136173 RepID=UPI001106670B|nr:hypothetical protein [Streptomyces sp. So13.3]QNA76939.1 hypothetical protein C8250_038285 [Streptomyces sp. So13.3]